MTVPQLLTALVLLAIVVAAILWLRRLDREDDRNNTIDGLSHGRGWDR